MEAGRGAWGGGGMGDEPMECEGVQGFKWRFLWVSHWIECSAWVPMNLEWGFHRVVKSKRLTKELKI